MAAGDVISSGISIWKPNYQYFIDDVVSNPLNHRIYRSLADFVSSPAFVTDIVNWQELAIANEPWVTGKQLYSNRTYYSANVHGVQLYVATVDYITGVDIVTDIAAGNLRPLTNYTITAWMTGYGYLVDYVVIYNNLLYRCIVPHVAGAAFDPANWQLTGGGLTTVFLIPNNQATPLDVTDLSFNSANETRVRVSITSTRVAGTPLVEIENCYDLVISYINTRWVITQVNLVITLGAWDGVAWSITAAGQVQIVTSDIAGVYDTAQSKLAFSISVRG